MYRGGATQRMHPRIEILDSRELLSVAAPGLQGLAQTIAGEIRSQAILTNPAGVSAILSALNGGAGAEFVTLIRREVPNLGAILGKFESGRLSTYSIPGLTVSVPYVLPSFTGHIYDQLTPTEAGALLLKHNVFELAAIMRGPFHDPATSYYVFALDRGAGARLGPTFPSKPGITPDMLVTLTIGPYGQSASGVIEDLASGSVQTINPSAISVNGPTVRVYLNASQAPSEGFKFPKYRFAFWTQTVQNGDISTVPNILPADSMDLIGVLKNVNATH